MLTLLVPGQTNLYLSPRDSDLESRGRDKQDTAKFLFVMGVLNEMGTCLFGESISDIFSWEQAFHWQI